MTPKWWWTLKAQRYPIYDHYPWVPNYSPICSTASHFWVTGHFETLRGQSPKFHSASLYRRCFQVTDKCTEWPLNDLEHEEVKGALYICYNYPWVLNFTPFALRPAIFELQAILRQVHQMTSKSLWTIIGQRCPICMLPPSPKLHSVSLDGQPFSSFRPFWDKCTEWPQNNLEH